MKVLLIIPAYNEEKNLPKLLNEIKKKCPKFDTLVVNDCSKDNTCILLKQCKIQAINLPINLGIGGAVQTGYLYAYYNGYDIAVQIDGDGQHDPIFISNLIDEISNGYDLCIGSRFIDKNGFQSSFVRKIGISYFSFLIKLFCGEKITDPTSGFKSM